MNTLLYTGHDAAYSTLADITVPRMESYAMKHGMDFMCFTEPLIDVPNGIYWTGVCGAIQAFEKGYERAIYLDVDQLVTNFDFRVRGLAWGGFHVSRDWGEDAATPSQFSACGFMAHKNDCVDFLKSVLDLEPEFRDKPFPEQNPMQQKGKKFKWINFHPRRTFNAVPDAVCPGKVPEPWAPGDWCAHLTMLPIDDRVKLAKEILSKL